jgi:dCMP deaminase
VRSLNIFKEVKLLDKAGAKKLNAANYSVVTASEEVSRKIAAAYFPKAKNTFDTIFLRWDEASVKSDQMPANVRISESAFDQKMMARAAQLSENSSDWWRHVGALMVKNKKVVLERFNTHVPSAHTQYVHGDPRDFFQAGVKPEVTTAMHCEQGLVTDAAREGISLKGASLYTTVFPCAMCSKQIAYSGISKCFYASGHADLDGETIMKSQGIELVFVKMPK